MRHAWDDRAARGTTDVPCVAARELDRRGNQTVFELTLGGGEDLALRSEQVLRGESSGVRATVQDVGPRTSTAEARCQSEDSYLPAELVGERFSNRRP